MPVISIITPFFNSKKYLKEYIDSILNQTLESWELILVDDGSSDGSEIIADNYAKDHDRITVIHKENGGVSSARNIGLDNSTGEYIFFADSDDIVLPDGLKTMVEKIRNHSSIISNYQTLCHNKEIQHSARNSCDVILSPEDQVSLFYLVDKYKFQGYLWNRLFRRDIIKKHNIRFDESISFKEDGLFIIEYLCKCKDDILYINEETYIYRENPESVMAKSLNKFEPKTLSNLKARALILELLKDNNFSSSLVETAKMYLAYGCRRTLSTLIKSFIFTPKYHLYICKLVFKHNLIIDILKKQF